MRFFLSKIKYTIHNVYFRSFHMLSYPKEFFYEASTSYIQYQQEATSSLSLDRLIKGNSAFWISPSLHQAPKKKKLILADWSASSWSHEKTIALQKKIQQLIDDGFEVALSNYNSLISLSLNNVHLLSQFSVRRAMAYQTIEDISASTGVSCEKLLILDDYWIKQLLSGKIQLEPRVISLYEYHTTQYDVARYLHEAYPPLERIINDYYSDVDNTSHFEDLPQVPVENKQCRALSLLKRTIEQIELVSLDTLFIDYNEKHLKTLWITPSLEKIKFEDCSISGSAFRQLHQLRGICLNNCDIRDAVHLPARGFTHVDEIKISGTISNENLNTILLAATQLKALKLGRCKPMSVLASLPPQHFSQLEVLDLTGSEINYASLNPILLACTSLKQLTLEACQNIDTAMKLPQAYFSALEVLDVGYSDITSESLNVLLQAAPQLKKIFLTKCDYLEDLPTLSPGCLTHLEEIDLSDNNFPLASLYALLQAAPRLKTIKCSCDDSDEINPFSEGSLPYLEELNLTDSQISSANLTTLLLAAPNLIILRYDEWEQTEELENLPPNYLLKLYEMDFKNAKNLSPSTLIHLMNAATNLEALYIPDGSFLESLAAMMHLLTPIQQALIKEAMAKAQAHSSLFSQDQRKLDANTSNPGRTYRIQRIFYSMINEQHPTVDCYRINEFNSIELSANPCLQEEAFEMILKGDLQLIRVEDVPQVHPEPIPNLPIYIGYYTKLLSQQWLPLPSLSANERMHSFQSNAPSLIELAYSSLTNLYYVRLNQPDLQLVSIEYTITIYNNNISLPAHIQSLVNYFLNFRDQPLTLDEEYNTGQKYMEAILQQQTGACRHRAFGFKYCMDMYYPNIPTRILTNMCHAFVEIYMENQWVRVDLGGYPARLNVLDANRPSLINSDKNNLVEITSLKQLLQTWDRKNTPGSELLPYLQQCVNESQQNRLIELTSNTATNGFRFALEYYCNTINRPFFYISSPDDLICNAPTMKLGTEGIGILHPAPSGPLHDFLTHHKKGVLLTNYNQFSYEDLVRFNALVDKVRLADGTPVPEQMAVIGLMANNTTLKPGSDFYSRFDVVEPCPVDESRLTAPLHPVPTPSSSTVHFINLYRSPDWEAKLIGRWVPREGQWFYEEGCLHHLLPKLPQKATLTIQNGLWEDSKFVQFWQEALQNEEIHTPSGPIFLPRGLILARNEEYDWERLGSYLIILNTEPTHYHVLNASTYSQFFSRYEVKKNHLEASYGLIQQAAQSVMALYLTHILDENQWAELLSMAEAHQVTLQVYSAPNVTLPEKLPGCKQPSNVLPGSNVARLLATGELQGNSTPGFVIIESTDVDVSIAHQLTNNPNSLVIDVSELTPSDLLTKISVTLDRMNANLQFIFNETPGLLNTVQDPIILKGRFSKALAETLAPLVLKHPSMLTLISEDTSLFGYSNARVKHQVSPEEKKALLQEQCPQQSATFTSFDEPFVQLMSRAHCLQRGKANTDDAWIGYQAIEMNTYDPQAYHSSQGIYASNIAKYFMLDRKKAVQSVLDNQPYVFLTGLSGVGKSTFVNKELCEPNDVLFQENDLLKWVSDTNPNGYLYLFIDEANLKHEEFSRFEGLFNSPPGILIDGIYYPLTSQHKVIFAGNPINYGDERQLASLFKRHGNAVLFEPIPSAVVFEKVIKPALDDRSININRTELAQPFLDVYRFLCLKATSDIPISPRELEMMALLTLSFYKHNPDHDLLDVAGHMAFQVAKPLVPPTHLIEFNRLFKPIKEYTQAQLNFGCQTEYLVSPSRQDAYSWLNTLLTLREDRASFHTDTQKYGGLGAVILEGEPGIGKSELVTNALLARHYSEVSAQGAPLTQNNSFYRVPVSMPLQEKENLLRKAFDEGAIVVIDEINSSPMMERLINALLMGKTPEGRRPTHPGFFVIGTQNPSQMAGRREMSTALKRRSMTLNLEPYSSNEMENILMRKGLTQTKAQNLVTAFAEQKSYAIKNQLSPIPTFRDLLRAAKRVQTAQERATHQHLVSATQQEHDTQYRGLFFNRPREDIAASPTDSPSPQG